MTDLVPPRDRQAVKLVVAVVLAFGILALGAIGYRTYVQRYTVSTREDLTGEKDSSVVAGVVTATLFKAGDLRVSRLTGVVQGVGRDVRGFGMLQSQRVVKSPFEVDYFIDLSGLGARDFHYDAKTNTLLVRAPGIRIGRPDIDESRTTLDNTDGLFVTRAAMAAMQKQVATSAMRVASEDAKKPENLAKARESGRTAIARLFGAPLRAAGIEATVKVRFADDPVRNDEQWDMSRSLEEVLGNAK
ncbi:conserved hypothetical protein [Sphingomonas sp. EC-HK361]|uniref:DUF4230 domain-containing protein n=1 Tax=Sphingomonas sp. EC-HK361 TaxID=2038397 RepID=UPI001258A549|nr:DUF4230 domain-containing protein [Sphingomonas sp. EC-HK361]VVT03755.1 conserved hypothetical protein [Sphingomonas sp. EC-HK361]